MNQSDILIGSYRPIYLWAGPGTIRMNRLKFMQVPVNENIHMESHGQVGADIVVNTMKQNWVHLTYSWGFPPEVEQEDWESFQQATKSYHAQNVDVFAYIQTSNCVFDGSNKLKKWFALDPQGRKFFYYTNRFMTCLQNQEWIAFLHDRIKGAIDRGADGIFFDNLWYGTQPSGFGGSWLGSAGCYCDLCKRKYRDSYGDSIPELIDPSDPRVERYLNWRSDQLTIFFRNLSNFARSLKQDVRISANDYDVIMRPSKLIYGIDFKSYADIQDLMMIEDFCLPNWEPGEKTRFPNNAMTIRVARSQLPDQKHLSVLSYDVGIGFDDVYPARRILQGMSEITALGASVTTKGTEYFDGFEMTLITCPKYKEQQKAIGDFNYWLQKHRDMFINRKNISPVTLIHPGDNLWKRWFQISPIFYGCMQTLTRAGIPWKVVPDTELTQHSNTVFTFTESDQKIPGSNIENKFINVPDLKDWQIKSKSYLSNNKKIHKITSWIIESLIRSYHSQPVSRKLMDQFGMAKIVTQTPLFFMPSQKQQRILLDSIIGHNYPKIICAEPVLIDLWQTSKSQIQIHLVNYAKTSQTIKLIFEKETNGEIIHLFDTQHNSFEATSEISFPLDIYSIILMNDQKGEI
ncbi:MAG: alpha-amylase family protein [Anaerolineaceae bacterium]